MARGFPDWKKFPKPKSAGMKKIEKGDIRMKLTGFAMSVFRDMDHISALGDKQESFITILTVLSRFPHLVTVELF